MEIKILVGNQNHGGCPCCNQGQGDVRTLRHLSFIEGLKKEFKENVKVEVQISGECKDTGFPPKRKFKHPVVFLDGRIISVGRYPCLDELKKHLKGDHIR